MGGMSAIGRPSLPKEYSENIVRKLEPFLKMGMSLRKACFESGVPRQQVYYWMNNDQDFSDKIQRLRQYLSIMVNGMLFRELLAIVKRQNNGLRLDQADLRYLQWYALNSPLSREEFGRRVKMEAYDSEVEIARIAEMVDSCSMLRT